MEHISEPILAAIIGAMATFGTAILQIFRNQSQPESKAKRRKSWIYTMMLMLACGVSGFAYSEFRDRRADAGYEALSQKLQAQLNELSAATSRAASVAAPVAAGAPTTLASTFPDDSMGTAAVAAFPACKGAIVGFATQPAACTEQNALRIAVCTSVPVAAKVTYVEAYARFNDAQSWTSNQLAVGEIVADGKFEGTYFEHTDNDGTKQACQTFAHWNSQPRSARIVARYKIPAASVHATATPAS
ncbi:MAG: hypothetical protein EXR36_10230 [Betaproteobacteria bacterium]|nr:hypothetical protein [Betaproteobacteria bacterium]